MANIQNNVIMNWKFINQPLGQGDLSGGYAPQEKRFFWVPAIIAAASIASAAIGGAQSAKANKKAREQVDSERAANQAERRRNMYESWTDTAKGQNTIRQLREETDRLWKKEQGAAAVAGATDASKQMAKDAAMQTIGDTVANITANDQERRDARDDQYRAQDRAYANQQIALDQQAGQIKAQAATQMASALANAATSYLGASIGTGSPGGGGVTAAGTGNALNNMASTPASTSVPLTPEMQMAQGMNAHGVMGYNNNYQLAAPIWRNNFMGGIKI